MEGVRAGRFTKRHLAAPAQGDLLITFVLSPHSHHRNHQILGLVLQWHRGLSCFHCALPCSAAPAAPWQPCPPRSTAPSTWSTTGHAPPCAGSGSQRRAHAPQELAARPGAPASGVGVRRWLGQASINPSEVHVALRTGAPQLGQKLTRGAPGTAEPITGITSSPSGGAIWNQPSSGRILGQ